MVGIMELEKTENCFKDHVVKLEDLGSVKIIKWADPKTIQHSIKYVLHENNIFISGDCGEAVFNLTEQASLENLKDYEFRYFFSKIATYSGNKYDFDDKLAKEELNKWYKEMINHCDDKYNKRLFDLYNDLKRNINEWSDVDGYHFGLNHLCFQGTHGEMFDSEELEEACNFGSVPASAIIFFWVGLKMIIDKLTKCSECFEDISPEESQQQEGYCKDCYDDYLDEDVSLS